jgi:hypothetical protein
MAVSKCDKCYQTRWLVFSARFTDNGREGQFRAFDRGNWNAYGELVLETAIARGVLKPCECNPRKLPPWSKAFEVQDAPVDLVSANAAPLDAGGTPF